MKSKKSETLRKKSNLESELNILQAVMNSAKKVHLVYLDRDFNFVRVNEAYAATCNYAPEQMIGKNHFALYPHEENEAIFKRVRDTGIPAEFHDKPFAFPDQPERGITYWDWTLEPVKDSHGKVEGLVFSLVETTERKRAKEALQEQTSQLEKVNVELEARIDEQQRIEQSLREAHKYADSIIETLREPLVVLDADLRVKSANQAFYNTFKVSPDETEGELIYDLGNRQWDIPKLQLLLEEIIPRNTKIHDFEVEHQFPSIDRRTMMLNARRIYLEGVGTQTILLAFEDITERKLVEEALQRSEERLRLLYDLTMEGIVIHDKGIIVESNDALAKMFGYGSASEIVGMSGSDLMTPETRRLFVEHMRTDSEEPYEGTGIKKNGTLFPIEIHARNIVLKGSRVRAGTVYDLTERKRAEEMLRESEQKFMKVFRGNAAAIALTRLSDGKLIDVNDKWQELFGLSRDKIIGGTTVDMFKLWKHPQERKKAISDVKKYGSFRNRECEFLRKNGEEWTALLSSELIQLQGEEVILSSSIDITERMLAEAALQKAHDELEVRVQERTAELEEANRYIQEWATRLEETNIELEAKIEEQQRAEDKIREQAELLDKAHDAIGVRDLNHNLLYWNKGAEHLYGWTLAEAVGKNADMLLYTKESPAIIEAKKKVIEEGEWYGELSQITKDGKEIIVESRWTLMRDNNKKPKSILIINTDITEKKKFESQLLRAQRMESIGTLAGGIAHDLNNMLTPIMLSLQILKQKYKDEQSQKLLTILDNNTRRGADLIKQVLSFSRGVEGERIPLQTKHIITEIERIIRETFPKSIEIRTDIQRALPTISGDATQLHQVMMNLCLNARDAMPDGGILKIAVKNFFINENFARVRIGAKVGSYAVISVSDTGTGIPPKIIDRIFEPFFTTKEFGKGTGLGLSTALAIVKSHGGFIDVQSEVGKGSTFRVYLPAVKAEMKNVKEEQPELPLGHGELVLVVEDEDSIREVTLSTLEDHGYNVLVAKNGAEAVELYARNKDEVSVVLMDMMMPVMDGEKSIQAIHQINPEVRVIVVSGLAEKDKLAKIESTNAQAILPKPYTTERLLKAVHEVLSAK